MDLKTLLFGQQCKYCGKRALEEIVNFEGISMRQCNSCNTIGVYGHIPKCRVCGTLQRNVGLNEYNVPVPKCPHCGYLWDCFEYGE